MSHSWLRTMLLIMLFGVPLFAQDSKPELSKTPLSADQIAVYRTFLASYDNGSDGILNLGDRTTQLDFTSPRNDVSGSKCLEGVTLEHPQDAITVIHRFEPNSFDGNRVRLVDAEKQHRLIREHDPSFAMGQGRSAEDAVGAAFASGLLQFSEVIFDAKHEYAVMSFSFVCGGLCGHGGVVVFQKVDGVWKQLNRPCSQWIS